MLILDNVCKKYNGSNNEVLKKVNLVFPERGLVSIIGKSGSGKSTLLNIIGLIDSVSSGNIYLKGKNITNIKGKELDYYHHHYVGFIHQSYNLINNRSVIDNINLFNNLNPDTILKSLELVNKKKSLVAKLSGGEKQRVAIARSIINQPSILLCDEPTGALDQKNGIKIMQILKKLSKKMLVIVVTHDETLALSFSDRIIEISDGKIIRDDKAPEIKNERPSYHTDKFKIKFKYILKIIFNNLRLNIKRNVLIIFAFLIGLLALSTVLAISNGFAISLKKYEKSSLSEYPIVISESTTDAMEELDSLFSSEEINEDKIIVKSSTSKNILDKNLLNTINSLDIKHKVINYLDDNKIFTFTDDDYLNNLELLKGRKTIKSNELLVMLDSNNNIEKEIIELLALNNNEYSYEELLNKSIFINKKKYVIVGIAKNKKNSVNQDNSGIIRKENKGEILSIILYPYNFENKELIINTLRNNSDVKFTDYAKSITSISTTIMKGISLVLTIFSLISLFVSTIMISIITIISVIERTKEIGIYKSLGASNKDIKKIFIFENIIIGLISSVLAILIEAFISIPLNHFIYDLTELQNVLSLSVENVLSIIILGILFSSIGSLIPLKRISKVSIIDTLRYE